MPNLKRSKAKDAEIILLGDNTRKMHGHAAADKIPVCRKEGRGSVLA